MRLLFKFMYNRHAFLCHSFYVELTGRCCLSGTGTSNGISVSVKSLLSNMSRFPSSMPWKQTTNPINDNGINPKNLNPNLMPLDSYTKKYKTDNKSKKGQTNKTKMHITVIITIIIKVKVAHSLFTTQQYSREPT